MSGLPPNHGDAVEPELAEPFELASPASPACSLVFSSPHSGNVYPLRFLEQTRLDSTSLRRSEDAHVDVLFACAQAIGAPLLRAKFPRAYLDLNREPYELDPRMFEDSLPEFANTRSLRVAAGLGTIPRVVADAREIYAGKLAVAEALRRIEALYKPYHATLASLMESARKKFGLALLIDCHSMPSVMARDPGHGVRSEKRRVDFVIGDRFGASCDTGVVELIERRLRGFGYNVQRNRPYAGGFITEHYGRPASGWQAVQIEVARGLYMNEVTLDPNERFSAVAAHLGETLADLAREFPFGESAAPETRAAAE
ncbi:MAG: N-formylglutamate amidohydrolase [Methylocystis sp.]|jgi:N-formylglutamate amidohydrolase